MKTTFTVDLDAIHDIVGILLPHTKEVFKKAYASALFGKQCDYYSFGNDFLYLGIWLYLLKTEADQAGTCFSYDYVKNQPSFSCIMKHFKCKGIDLSKDIRLIAEEFGGIGSFVIEGNCNPFKIS